MPPGVHRGFSFLITLLLFAAFFLSPEILVWKLGSLEAAEVDTCKTSAAKDLVSHHRLEKAQELEAAGNIEHAESEYAAALASSQDCIRTNAATGLERLARFRRRAWGAGRVLAEVADVALHVRSAFVASLVLIAFGWLILRLTPRRSTRITGFPVYGAEGEAASKLFRNALASFANEIKRVYGSEYAKSLGITLVFDDLKGQSLEERSAYDEALEEIKDPEGKTAVRYALGYAIRMLRQSLERPLIVVEGDVRLSPGSAQAVARIKNARTKSEIRVEANTAEITQLPESQFVVSRMLGPGVTHTWLSRKAEEQRLLSQQLQLLALVLACKIRMAQLQGFSQGYKPTSWRTVCIFTAAALTLE